ncbi:hypothetical protein BGZ95_003825 [Linnemannia exigua]|uniref:Uncharacterized protein n=1 Tax=Linnemannia exigua TaxID=604196 RepID=A0AAD4DLV5_9FUNG|nr:hypothetical protein BGZ95_003825 [Linnemannia exigua]
MENQQGEQYQRDIPTSSSSYPSRSPNPPVLSFRAFHATHFTWSQRQAFFGGGAPVTPGAHNYPPFPIYSHSVETDTLARSPESARVLYHNNAQSCTTADDKKTNHHNNNATATAEVGLTRAGSEAAEFGLTQEAIEIFEFSRRFREEKAAAVAMERARMARRRTKRRRLTKRGFAPDEGNSGSDEPLDVEHDNNNKRDDFDDEGSGRSENEDDGGDDEEEDGDEFVAQCEPLATDTAFLTQPSRQRDRTRQRLYGLEKLSDSKNKDVSLVLTETSTSTSTSDDMWSIRMLEAMLNQTFVDSLSSGSTISTKEAVPGNLGRQSRDSGRRSRSAKSRSSQQSQVVYWPGMPMRC